MIKTFLSTEVKTVNTTASWHWCRRKRYVDAHKWCVHNAFKNIDIPFPCRVQLIRYGVKDMDTDNLYASLKSIRDAIADKIIPGLRPGMADGNPGIDWEYSQQRCKKLNAGVMVIITPYDEL